MTTTGSATCVYCGTLRPRTTEICPTCGRGWIDHRIVETAPAPAVTDLAAAETPEKPYPSISHTVPVLPPLPEPRSRRGLWFAVTVMALAVSAVIIGIVVSGDTPDSGEPGPTTTAGPLAGGGPSSTVSSTTVVPTSAPPSTTTTTTSTTTAAPLPAIEAIGDAVPITALSLGAFAIGPFDFDAPAGNPIGRLVATFGQPDDLGAADESWGLCQGESGRAITWGPLTIVTRGTDDEMLVAYRLGPLAASGADHPAAAMTTLSGLTVGDTTQQLETIYANSTVDYTDVDGVASFRLLRSTDERLLLWGPVVDDAVAGIFSPRPCDQGP